MRSLPVSVVGVPKSIDNDILFIDKTFGFDSAVAAASRVIKSGWVEATSCKRGVGIVKLMGRDACLVERACILLFTRALVQYTLVASASPRDRKRLSRVAQASSR